VAAVVAVLTVISGAASTILEARAAVAARAVAGV